MFIFTRRNPKKQPGRTSACFHQGTNNAVQYLFFQATVRKDFTSHISSDILFGGDKKMCEKCIFNYMNEGSFKNPFILWALYAK